VDKKESLYCSCTREPGGMFEVNDLRNPIHLKCKKPLKNDQMEVQEERIFHLESALRAEREQSKEISAHADAAIADRHREFEKVAERDAKIKEWNSQVSMLGCAGSEFHDDPKMCAEFLRERDAMKDRWWKKAKHEVAERDALIKKKDEVLERIEKDKDRPWGSMIHSLARDARALPTDGTGLKEYVKKVTESLRESVELLAYSDDRTMTEREQCFMRDGLEKLNKEI